MSIIKVDAQGRAVLPPAIIERLSLKGEDELQLDCLQDGTLKLNKVTGKIRFERWLE
jgi:bifunctional DNA-binding transcriptional regulator/antitoxin component of YhaV-PrlF toxin-antitoxin module